MANSKSALKRVRQTATRTARNRALKSAVKSARRATEEAVEAGQAAQAQEAYDTLASVVDKAAKRGALHKNTASRYKSRAAAKLKGLSA